VQKKIERLQSKKIKNLEGRIDDERQVKTAKRSRAPGK